jgi:alpha-glucosidase
MTNWTPRTLHVPLSFLAADRTYIAEIYEDADDAATNLTHVRVHKQTVHSSEMLTLNLAPGGGCAIRFIPANKK